MKFSVLLSIYHKENPEYLRQCMDSILSQTLLPDEIVMVKDGPLTEELDAMLDEYQQKISYMKLVPLKVNLGLGKALNEGLKHCSNELVARMDTDDICKSNRFERQVAIFKKHPEYDVVSSWVDEFSENVDAIRSVRKLPENHEEIFEYGKKRNPVNHPAVMFRKSAVEATGSYMHFPYFEDYYLWARMLMGGYKFYNVQESLLNFRTSDSVYMRRGGFAYAMTEVKFMMELHKIGYLGLIGALKGSALRFVVRIIPNSFRAWIYNKLLRK